MRFGVRAAALVVLVCLTACGRGEEAQTKRSARRVLSVLLAPAAQADLRFAGTIEPRFSTDRGFQVLGRIQSYGVDVGDLVKKGEPLAALDPTTFALDVRSKEGDLEKAKSQAANATAETERTRRLVSLNVSSQADLDANVQARDAAVASVQQAEAQLAKSHEQLGYATLVSDEDGVVTTKDADVGQTVSAGQKVMTIARTDVREAVIDLPEDLVGGMRSGAAFRVALQADPSVTATGRVREIAPQADASTRTRRTRITLDQPPEAFRLGTTITASPEAGVTAPSDIELPRSALLERDGATKVWVVDEKARTVRTVQVKVAGGDSGSVAKIESGLSAGQRVVVAGVHSLKEGQAIKLDEGNAK